SAHRGCLCCCPPFASSRARPPTAGTAPHPRPALRRFRTRPSLAAAQVVWMILLRFRRHDLALVAGSVHRWSAARNPYTEPSPTRQTDPVCRLLFVARAHSDPVFHRPFSGRRESDSAATEPSVGPKECPSIQVRQQRRVIWLISSSRRFLLPCGTFSFNKHTSIETVHYWLGSPWIICGTWPSTHMVEVPWTQFLRALPRGQR